MAWAHGTNAADETVVGLLRDCAQHFGDRPFLDFSGTILTYSDMWSNALALARGFREIGVEPGHRVVAMLDNHVDAVSTWFATNILGAIWVPINTALRGEFLRHVVHDAGAGVVVCEADFVDRLARVEEGIPEVRMLLVRRPEPRLGPTTRFETKRLDDIRLSGSDEIGSENGSTANDVSCLVYTGGTTGPSKGCVISNGYVFNAARGALSQMGRTADEVNWSPLPIFHYNLINCTILATMLIGSTAAIAPRFSVSGFWPDIERSRARVVNLLGSMGALIAQMPDTPEMDRCHGQIRMVHGAPFPPALQHLWRERFGVEWVGAKAYGLTESFPLTTLPVGVESPERSSGKANTDSFDVRIFDDNDSELGPGEVGEVVARPIRPNVMFQGYWGRPEATWATMSNLWWHTGDLGTFDEEGFFTFVDRKKDSLRRRGENISSQEMEATYLLHPAISQVAVHAVPSEMTEDEVKVTAVLHPEASLTAVELFEWSKDRVPYFALPRYIEFREELPLSPIGRVHKYQLREEGCTESTWDRETADVVWDRR
jgi:crotonobetaine/carnitine-CoA ligase